MAYSGTVGQTVVSVQALIDQGARYCGKLAEELTSEHQISARLSLFTYLSSLINFGIQYWAIEKTVIGLRPDQYAYELPPGAVDALNVLYRTLSRPAPSAYLNPGGGTTANAFDGDVDTICTQTVANSYLGVDYGADNATYLGSIGVLPGVAGSFHAVIEYSSDGSTWSTLYDPGVVTWVDNEWLWYDIDPGVTARYYRLRETGGNTLVLRELYFGDNSTELPMARLNRDDYTSLPNKNFTANQPYQFWFNRTIPVPTLNLWPTPSDAFVQMTVWYSRQIMDVGDLTGELEVPNRWLDAVQYALAHRLSMIIPGVPMERISYLEDKAKEHLHAAEQEERDKSPIYFAPGIGVYTR